jgi:glycosyltransferase involved in cell wall biosynthesis
MRILHVIGGVAPRYGGPSAALPALCRAVMDRGHHVEVFTTDIDGPGRLPLPTGRPILWHGVSTTVFPVRRPRAYALAPALGLALRRVDEFDVVHIHSLYRFHTLAATFWCRRRGVPYVLRPHGSLNPYHRATRRTQKAVYELLVERRNLDRAAAIHCTSQAEADAVMALGVRAPVAVVPLPVEVSRYAWRTGPHLQARSGGPALHGRRLVTFLGRITPKKGADVLVDALARIAPDFPDVVLAIAGPDGGHLGEVLARVQAHGLTERVHVLGLVTGDEKVALLQASTVVALPSLDENFALSVAEALAAGTPVVVSPGVALHREIAAAGAGLVAPRAAESVARALARLLSEPALAARCSANGRALAARLFAPEQVGEQLEALYRAVQSNRTAQQEGA